MPLFADVYVSYPLDEIYTYRIPEKTRLLPGMRARVNFAGREITAFVAACHDREPTGFIIKNIIRSLDDEPIFDNRLLGLAAYVSSSYLASMGECMAMALPSGESPSDRYKPPYARSNSAKAKLSAEQSSVCEDMERSSAEGQRVHLLFGITGSGKTEIYIEMAKRAINSGKSVIYLVPEITLSSQIWKRLNDVFGDDLVLYHSQIPASQRLHHWKRFYNGDARIAIGTRSACFLQCPDLGLMIIDEEHDSSYKEHSTPRYNARRVAMYRSNIEKAMLIMGSATPAIESLHACENGRMKLHRLESRFGGASLPQIEIVRIESGSPKSAISLQLKILTMRAAEQQKQAVYLLNRRGFSPILMCNECGHVFECELCSISLNLHRDSTLRCHYCGFMEPEPESCVKCGSSDLAKLGSGTQRIEDIINATFPGLRIFRLDQDTSRRKNTVREMVDRMNSRKVDILLGTQLVAKGFDFHEVVLVGVLLADIGLNLPDFRSSERIFALLMQVSGRSGRGSTPGRVIIQTLNDANPIYSFLKAHDYYGFYKSEIELRKALFYPPYSRLARLLVRGKNEERVYGTIKLLKEALDVEISRCGMDIRVLGPSSAPLSKIGGNFRHHMVLKAGNIDELREVIVPARSKVQLRDVYLEVDIDPYDLL